MPRQVPRADVIAASKTILRAVQEELLQRPGLPPSDEVDQSAHMELAHRRHWALHAVIDKCGKPSMVKRLDLDVTEGAPLTVCTGATLPKGTYQSAWPPFLAGVVIEVDTQRGIARLPVPGCLRIFPDTTQTSRKPWRYWCPDCRSRQTALKRQLRSQIRSAYSA